MEKLLMSSRFNCTTFYILYFVLGVKKNKKTNNIYITKLNSGYDRNRPVTCTKKTAMKNNIASAFSLEAPNLGVKNNSRDYGFVGLISKYSNYGQCSKSHPDSIYCLCKYL